MSKLKMEVPAWLKTEISATRPELGTAYELSIQQGFLELPHWAYHLKDEKGNRLLDSETDVQLFFDAIFMRTQQDPGQLGLRVLAGEKAEHYILFNARILQEELERVGLSEKYTWQPKEDK